MFASKQQAPEQIAHAVRQEIAYWRETVFSKISRIIFFVMIPLWLCWVIPFIFLYHLYAFLFLGVFNSITLGIIAFAHTIPFVWRVRILLLLTYLNGTLWFLSAGLLGVGRIYYILLIVFSIMFLNHKEAVFFCALSLVTMGIMLLGYHIGFVPMPVKALDRSFDPMTLGSSWIAQSIGTGFVGSIIFLSIKTIQQSLQRVYTHQAELQQLNAELEQRIAERTESLTQTNNALQQEIYERQQAEQRMLEQERAVSILQERERLARELHDNFGQVLGYVNTQTQAIQKLLEYNDQTAAQILLEHIVTTVQHTSLDIRDYILGVQIGTKMPFINKQEFTAHWVVQSINTYVSQFQQIHNIAITFTTSSNLQYKRLIPTIELHLLSIVQEALTNVRKHAQATQVEIRLDYRTDSLILCIQDNGHGFCSSPNAPPLLPDGSGFGLTSIRGRVSDMAGTLEITSCPECGTHLHITLPLQQQHFQHEQSSPKHAIRVLLVDDNDLFLYGLHHLLTVHGFQVVGTARNGKEAVAQAHALNPDVILMDVNMPESDGLEATRVITAALPKIQIVMLTVSDDDTHLFEAIKYGATGYLLKSLHQEELCKLLLGLRHGEALLSPGLAARILQEFARDTTPPQPVVLTDHTKADEEKQVMLSGFLTMKQKTILMLLVQGYRQYDIATRLDYSERTLRRQITKIIATLHVKNRQEAIAYAYQKMEDGTWTLPADYDDV